MFPSGTTRPDASNLNFVAGTAAGRFYPFVPNRAFDTRTSPRINGVVAPIGQAGVLNLTLRNELPATSHYAAVLVNVTATRATSGGYLTVYPTGDVLPTSSNLNFKAGQTVANAVIVKLGPNETRFVPVGGAGGAPAGAIGVVLNATVTDTTAGSYLSVWPAGLTQPTVSSLNWGPGETVPNFVGVAVLSAGGTAGQLAIYNDGGAADVLVDVTGYFYPARLDRTGRIPLSRIPFSQHNVELCSTLCCENTAPVDLTTLRSS